MGNNFENASECWKELLKNPNRAEELLALIAQFARKNIEPTKIVFGTSGWRGEIGSDFTFNNVRLVTNAILNMFKSNDLSVMSALGVKNFDDIKQRGVIVGHDNRFLGRDFAIEVIGILQSEGIKTWYAGESATPEFSAAIEMLNAACSINLTPSHNPANYAGFKFNPSDGGPAGAEITSVIEQYANEMSSQRMIFEALPIHSIDQIDITDLYIKYITERATLDLAKIRSFVLNSNILICIDNMHGATRGKVQRILGECDNIVYLRTNDDYLFGGVAPEPSEANMVAVDRILKNSNKQLRLGAIMDPDGDRIRFSDGVSQIPMNYFGGMALHFLYTFKGIKGVVAKSVGTSNFVNAIAEKLAIPIKETKVGFKNFRPYMLKTSSERAIVAFEESDGISGYNNTLEKDALFGLLLAIEMMAVTGKNLSAYLRDIMEEFGAYYPDRAGISVDKSLVGEPLLQKLSAIKEKFTVGTEIRFLNKTLKIKQLITVDGIKIVLEDGSWFMIRPSGTEPKVRFYIEARSQDDKEMIFKKAEEITKEVLS